MLNPVPKPKSVPADKREKQRAKLMAWRRVRAWVLVRDLRKCRVCKTAEGVDVHHIKFRSVGGEDTPENLAVLCRVCHQEIHSYRLSLSGNANGKLRIERTA
jgi:5-methylcytosine-specific restriction endonuclease McrA